MRIDLNCDMGESFGAYPLGDDAEVMPHITSANIACGLHAGDPIVMRRTVALALKHSVAIGAHPGFPDLQGFGRRKMILTPDEIEAFVLYQIGALSAFVEAAGTHLSHVKAHGALYNQAAKDRAIADAIARAVRRFNPKLVLVGLAGSALIDMGQEHGLQVSAEAFPDRGYQPDGSLIPRGLVGALVEDPAQIAENACQLVKDGIRAQIGGNEETFSVNTLCLHGDHPNAAETAKIVRETLEKRHIKVQALKAGFPYDL